MQSTLGRSAIRGGSGRGSAVRQVVREVLSAAEVPRLLETLKVERVLLVMDQRAFELSGAAGLVGPWLVGRDVARFGAFTPNPKDHEIDDCISLYRQLEPQIIIAVGGGSTLDVAKLTRACAREGATARDVICQRVEPVADGPPLLAIPTTAGTGSEATHFSAVYVDGIKHSLMHESMRPRFVLLDERLTESLPPAVTLASGLDAMCQAIESLWSVRSTPRSRSLAARGLEMVWHALPNCLSRPTRRNRREMLVAAHLAGRAIDLTQTTAAHALSYTLTSRHGLPHGLAVGLMIGPVWEFNRTATVESLLDPRGLGHVTHVFEQLTRLIGASRPDRAAEVLRLKLRQLGAPVCFGDSDIPDSAVEQVAAEIDPERLANNPRRLLDSDVRALLRPLLRRRLGDL